MLLKNARIYQLTEPVSFSASEFEAMLKEHEFTPCAAYDQRRVGWHPLFGKKGVLTYASEGRIWFALCMQDKLLPTSVVNDELAVRIEELEATQGYPVKPKDKGRIKDDVFNGLLPQAFCKSKLIYAYLDTQHNWLVVGTSSANQADDFIEQLNSSCDDLPFALPKVEGVALSMASWLHTNEYPQSFTILDRCALHCVVGDEVSTLKCNGHDLLSDNIQAFLAEGAKVTELALSFKDEIEFTLTEDLVVKSIKYLNLKSMYDGDMVIETKEEQMAADFLLSSEIVSDLAQVLFETFHVEGYQASVSKVGAEDEASPSASQDAENHSDDDVPFEVEPSTVSAS